MSKTLKVDEMSVGQRLDSFLATNHSSLSRSYWKKMIQAENVLLNQAPSTAKTKLALGDNVTISLPKIKKTPEELPIIFKSANYIVLDKPAGVLSHAKDRADSEYTVADFIRPRIKNSSSDKRAGIVHRLDRSTSGVMITALNDKTEEFLKSQFAKRTVQKLYVAVVEGVIKDDEFTIDMPIARHPKKPQRFRAHSSGKPAQTTVRIVSRANDYSVILLRPNTGRTHQLRVHLSAINHRIVGDSLYGGQARDDSRIMLHSYRLAIKTTPKSALKQFTAKIPADMSHYVGEEELNAAIKQFN